MAYAIQLDTILKLSKMERKALHAAIPTSEIPYRLPTSGAQCSNTPWMVQLEQNGSHCLAVATLEKLV